MGIPISFFRAILTWIGDVTFLKVDSYVGPDYGRALRQRGPDCRQQLDTASDLFPGEMFLVPPRPETAGRRATPPHYDPRVDPVRRQPEPGRLDDDRLVAVVLAVAAPDYPGHLAVGAGGGGGPPAAPRGGVALAEQETLAGAVAPELGEREGDTVDGEAAVVVAGGAGAGGWQHGQQGGGGEVARQAGYQGAGRQHGVGQVAGRGLDNSI